MPDIQRPSEPRLGMDQRRADAASRHSFQEHDMFTRTNHFKLAVLSAALMAVAGCGSDNNNGGGGPTSPPPAGTTVAATPGLAFTPPSLTISAGQTVTFAFGSVGHNVFFDQVTGAPANIEGVNANVNVDRTFSTAGTFVYNCHIHPGMSGTIVVQ
jgi:plastocyanin